MRSSNTPTSVHHHALTSESNQFPDTLDDYIAVEPLGGGTKSVYLLTFKDDKKLVLKFAAHQEAIKIEMLWNAIYHALGVPVPSTGVYYAIPRALQQAIATYNPNLQFTEGFFQVAEYVTDGKLDDTVNQAKKNVIAHTILGNTDIKAGNFIGDKLIDAGSNFMYHGLGDARYERSHVLNELWEDKNGSMQLQTVAYRAKQEEALELLKKSYLIERTVREKTPLLGIGKPLETIILDKISERLDVIIRYFFANQASKTKTHIRANSQTTGAGVFTYKISNGKVEVLLSKRSGNDGWDNFGGSAIDEEDYELSDVAIREVKEESNSQINYSKEQLKNSAYHDLITIKKNGSYFLYRLYFKENQHVDLAAIQDHEHTEHRYVPLENILNALTPPTITEERAKTIQVLDGEQKPIVLFAPLYQMLKQTAVQKNLQELLSTTKLSNNHTQSLVREEVQPDDSSSSTLKVRNLIASSTEIEQQQVKTLIQHSNLLRELKGKTRSTHVSSTASTTNTRTQSEQHQALLLAEKYTPHDDKKNTEAICKDQEFFTRLTKEKKEYLCNIIEDFTKKERLGNHDTRYLYHGSCNASAFLYTFYKTLYQHLFIENSGVVFRLNNKYLSRFKTAEEFLAYCIDKETGYLGSDELPNESCISVNPFILGNHHSLNSCSLKYLINNYSTTPIDVSAALKELLEPLHIEASLIEQLITLHRECFASFGGALYQLSLSKEEMANSCYAATNMGRTYSRKESLNLVTILDEFTGSNIDLTDAETKAYFSDLQARLIFTKAHGLNSECVFWNEPSPDVKATALQKLEAITQKIVESILLHNRQQTGRELGKETPLLRITSLWKNDSKANNEHANITNELLSALYQSNFNQFQQILENAPKNYSLKNQGDFIKSQIFNRLLKDPTTTIQQFSTYLGKEWWKFYKTTQYNQFANFLSKIINQTDLINSQEAIAEEIIALSGQHNMFLEDNINRWMQTILTHIYRDKIADEAYFIVSKIVDHLYRGKRLGTPHLLDKTISYIIDRLDDNLPEDTKKNILTNLAKKKSFEAFLSFTKKAATNDSVLCYAYELLLTYFDWDHHMHTFVQRNPAPINYRDNDNNTSARILALHADTNNAQFQIIAEKDPAQFYAENNYGNSAISELYQRYCRSHSWYDVKKTNPDDIEAIFAMLVKHDSAHPTHRELAKQAAQDGHSSLFNIFSNINNLDPSEKINFFREATNHEKLLVIYHVTDNDMRDPALCKIIVENISLVRLFDTLPIKKLIMLLKSSVNEHDLLHFLRAFRYALEQKILPTSTRLLSHGLHDAMIFIPDTEKADKSDKTAEICDNDTQDEKQHQALTALIDTQKKILTCKEPPDYFAITTTNLIEFFFRDPLTTFDSEECSNSLEYEESDFLDNAPYKYYLTIIQAVEQSLFTPATLYAFNWQELHKEAEKGNHTPRL